MGKRKDLKYYLSLPYTIQITREDETTWFARVVELPGCMTEGDTPEEAADMIQDALAAWLEIALEDGRAIPEPQTREAYSGRFVVRVPRTLHQQLVEAAEQEGVSLNQFINVTLAGRVTRPAGVKAKSASIVDRTRAAKTVRAAAR
jgi:antitoxin HicB